MHVCFELEKEEIFVMALHFPGLCGQIVVCALCLGLVMTGIVML